jgi:hypothetical protein
MAESGDLHGGRDVLLLRLCELIRTFAHMHHFISRFGSALRCPKHQRPRLLFDGHLRDI